MDAFLHEKCWPSQRKYVNIIYENRRTHAATLLSKILYIVSIGTLISNKTGVLMWLFIGELDYLH